MVRPVTMFYGENRLPRAIGYAVGVAGWIVFSARALQAIIGYAFGPRVDSVYLYDWRVHYAGALDLLERTLYVDRGISVDSFRMPVDVFNLPPMAAVITLPIVPFGYEVGGLIWVAGGFIAVVVAAYLAATRLAIAHGIAITGLLLFAYSIQPFFVRVMVLGNANALMLLLVVLFAWAHIAKRQATAGLLLGLAVAIKVWPATLGILLIREGRWRELNWSLAFVLAQGIVVLLWLWPGAVVPMVDALRTFVPVPEGVAVLWTSWAREAFSWWPAWGSILVAGGLLAIPASGKLGLGLGILAGLSLTANIWDHYLPFFALALMLLLTSREAGGMWFHLRSLVSRSTSGSSIPTSR